MKRTPFRDRQRGSTVVMTAVMIIAMFAMAALAIDLGVVYTAHTSAQHAADAAALAGAFTFLNPATVLPTDAQNAAIAAAKTNNILGQSVAIAAADVNVNTLNRRVTVTVTRAKAAGTGIPTFFASVLGWTGTDVRAVATAEASDVATGSYCVKPVFIPNTVMAKTGSGNPNITIASACANDQYTLVRTNTGPLGDVTPFGTTQQGQSFAMRPLSPSNALDPSQYFSLDFGDGGSTYRCTLGTCFNGCKVSSSFIKCNQTYPIQTGNMVGPTQQGIGDLIGASPDVWCGIGKYGTAGSNCQNYSTTSRSLVAAPIWDDCHQTVTPGTNGQTTKVIGFAELFVDNVSNGNGGNGNGGGGQVNAHLVSVIKCTKDPSGGTGTGPYALPVRLVQNP